MSENTGPLVQKKHTLGLIVLVIVINGIYLLSIIGRFVKIILLINYPETMSIDMWDYPVGIIITRIASGVTSWLLVLACILISGSLVISVMSRKKFKNTSGTPGERGEKLAMTGIVLSSINLSAIVTLVVLVFIGALNTI